MGADGSDGDFCDGCVDVDVSDVCDGEKVLVVQFNRNGIWKRILATDIHFYDLICSL